MWFLGGLFLGLLVAAGTGYVMWRWQEDIKAELEAAKTRLGRL